MTEENSSLVFAASPEEKGLRLDAFLAGKVESWSRSRLQRLIDDGDVLVNQKQAKPSYKLHAGDEIDVDLVEVAAVRFEAEDLPIEVIYEDEHLAVVNKAAGMIVHPGAGVSSGTLANALAFHFGLAGAELAGDPGEDRDSRIQNLKTKIGIVHRLDKDTSGLMVVAKTEKVHEALSDQFRDREVFKQYVALVHGSTRDNSGRIDKPLARDRWHRTKMTVAANGRNALTVWKVRQRFGKFTLLEVEIKTGRTHQIRVHLASINHPVVGDETYNEGRDNTVADSDVNRAIESMKRVFLHAEKLSFTHPVTAELIEFMQPMPDELSSFLANIK